MCRSKGETVAHVVSECGNLAQTKYKGGRHDNVVWIIHWQLCGKCGLERANSWYEQKPEGVVESENFKILWDFTVQCDRKIEARRPYIVFRPVGGGGGGGSRGSNEAPLRPKIFILFLIFFAVADLTDCQDCQDWVCASLFKIKYLLFSLLCFRFWEPSWSKRCRKGRLVTAV